MNDYTNQKDKTCYQIQRVKRMIISGGEKNHKPELVHQEGPTYVEYQHRLACTHHIAMISFHLTSCEQQVRTYIILNVTMYSI